MVFQKLDINQDGVITFEEFIESCLKVINHRIIFLNFTYYFKNTLFMTNCWLNVDRTRQSRNHYRFSTPGPYDCRYPPPTLWKYHFCHLISLLVSRRRSNAANYDKQTTSLPKTICSLISNVNNNKILL